MPKFRKKPVIIEAEQYDGLKVTKGVCHDCADRSHVHTIHDHQIVFLEVGDWVIPEPNGVNFYPCKPDIFAATYEPVD